MKTKPRVFVASTQSQTQENDSIMAKKVVKSKKSSSEGSIPVGKTMGLRIQETWVALFEANEKAKRSEKQTDDELRKFMLKEFPTVNSKLFNQLKDGVLHRVQAIRSRYNRGGMTGGTQPKVQSHRYDENGNYADPKFSGKSGVLLEDLDGRYTISASENRKSPKAVKKVVKKVKKKVVKKVKLPKVSPAVSETSGATQAD
jgi:hypothetical protein